MTAQGAEGIELDRLNAAGARHASAERPRAPPKLTIWSLLRSPLTTIQRILAFITSFVPFLSQFKFSSRPVRRQLAPRDAASRFIREFDELYGRRHIPFEDSGYAQVTRRAKENLQFLMVFLLSEEHDDTPQFCKDILCDEHLREWISSNDCVVWAGNVADSESHTGIPAREKWLR
jgi:FAS-associated factor 2